MIMPTEANAIPLRNRGSITQRGIIRICGGLFERIECGAYRDIHIRHVSRFLVQIERVKRGGDNGIAWEKIIGIVRIDLNHLCNLFQIGRAENRLGFLLRFAQCRQQHPRQNCDDRDDDEELYQRKTINRFTLK